MEEPALPPSIEGEWHGEMSSALAAPTAALDLLATQRQQFDVIEADLESHLAELEQHLAAGLATADNDQHGELNQLAESLHQQADELSRQQTALATDRAEIASRQGELQLAREQIGRQHQEFAETKRQELEQLEHRTTELQAAESKLKQAERAWAPPKKSIRTKSTNLRCAVLDSTNSNRVWKRNWSRWKRIGKKRAPSDAESHNN